jgi:preprotein translocase subunit SecY
MLDRMANVFRIPELRRKLLITILLLAACRVGVYVPVPGVDHQKLAELEKNAATASSDILSVVNIFAGGALEKCAIFGLGVMPYISSSIIFQLLASVVPALEKLKKEGQAGYRKINQYTRYATVPLCFIQAIVIIGGMRTSSWRGQIFPTDFGPADTMLAAFLMTCGTMLLMWIGEQVDEFGIGSGISLIIMIDIIARLPYAITLIAQNFQFTFIAPPDSDVIGVPKLALLLLLFIGVVVGVIFVTRGQRRIPFQQAKIARGRRVYGGMKHYLPLGVNAAGVLPIIFAQSLMMFPSMIITPLHMKSADFESETWKSFIEFLYNSTQIGSFTYSVFYIALIFFFCYFWTAITFNPTEMADNLKEHGSFIPGIRPGRRTAEHLERIMNRITLPGAAFLSAIAIVPSIIAQKLHMHYVIAGFYGGTTLLIVVGVALDMVRRIEAELLMRHYDGLTRANRRHR